MSRKEEKMYDIQTLSQKLVSKKDFAYLSDYAMNLFADKCAKLDLLISELEGKEDPKVIEALRREREKLRRIGEALYIMNADVLTNLGLKVGKTGTKEFSGVKNAEHEGL